MARVSIIYSRLNRSQARYLGINQQGTLTPLVFNKPKAAPHQADKPRQILTRQTSQGKSSPAERIQNRSLPTTEARGRSSPASGSRTDPYRPQKPGADPHRPSGSRTDPYRPQKPGARPTQACKIGRASCRERVSVFV